LLSSPLPLPLDRLDLAHAITENDNSDLTIEQFSWGQNCVEALDTIAVLAAYMKDVRARMFDRFDNILTWSLPDAKPRQRG
jgi:hypothetical protein